MERALTVIDTDHRFDKGSQIALSSLTPNQIDNLFTLGRVWGFLKHHHATVAAGKRQWDYDLLQILPTILAAPDRAHANEAIVQWIDSLGEVPSCDASQCPPAPAIDLPLKPDVAWIHDSTTLGSALSMRLQRIYQNRPSGKQFFVSMAPGVGNPVFEHELSYGRRYISRFRLSAARALPLVEHYAVLVALSNRCRAGLARGAHRVHP